jgi:transcriptional regulator with XRE-family HTH domain
MVRESGAEIRRLRTVAGLAQADLDSAAGVSRAWILRLESGQLRRADVTRLAIVYTLLGHRLSLKAYPIGEPVRDQSQLSLLAAFDGRIAPIWRRTREAVMPIQGDLRAWDERLDGPVSIGVEAETRIRDIQAVVRSITAKQRDSGVQRVVLVVRGSHANRTVLLAHLPALRVTFPLSTREVMSALARGRDPGANGIVVLRTG